MKPILIVYATTEGHTAKIVSRIGDVIEQSGRRARIVCASDEVPPDLDIESYDGVIVGGSVHGGHHQRPIVTFVKENRAALERVRTAFFSVSLMAAGESAESHEAAMQFVRNFEEQTGWLPDMAVLFPGALLYTHYGWVKKFIMKMIVKRQGGPTDTSHDYELTNWESVTHFAEDFVASLEERASPLAPSAPHTERSL
ncbi:MAG: protoporphyrinogen oxidase [Polyangiaceae bacterium]|nr:hypothetical protein [Polyangiaceae bacterium]NUQ73647.1 protoporphyrinogen oxidase [Polyangiaceae bacterium]